MQTYPITTAPFARFVRGMLFLSLPFPATIFAQGNATSTATDQQIVKLVPYEVQADSDKSYSALNSNSITQFNIELDKLPITADIFDQAFMSDIAADSIEQMIESYSAGAGFSATDPGAAAAANQPLDRVANGTIQLRGLSTPAMQRDGFIPIGSFGNPGSTGTGYTNNFDTERVEIIMGPQSLLYGGSGDGGVINVVSKRARLGQPAFGSVNFQVDQYGNKKGQLDYGVGNNTVAVRVAILNEAVGGRRINVGGNLSGAYVQVAFRPFANTVVRLEGEQTTYDRINSTGNGNAITVSAASTSNDARNGDSLHYLLATDQVDAANGRPAGAGPIINGGLNWGNVDSLLGWWESELRINDFEALQVETTWSKWLSTEVQLGYNDYYDDWVHPGATFYTPNKGSSNPLGTWAMRFSTPTEGVNPGRTTDARVSALLTNDLFGGRAHSQTSIGADYIRHSEGEVYYEYFQADSNFNVLINPAVTANNGRTPMPSVYWSVANGPVKYPLFPPRSTRVNYNGINYVRMIVNEVSPAYISAANPLGVSSGGGSAESYEKDKTGVKGLFGVNYTQWMEGKLDTMVGFRLSDYQLNDIEQGASAPTIPGTEPDSIKTLSSNTMSFDVGADYALGPWLHPYFSFADSHDLPSSSTDPYGNPAGVSHAYNVEVGLKVQNETGTLSGSLALYHVKAVNATYKTTSTFENDINPSGLNGTFSNPGTTLALDLVSEGVQAALTAQPTPNWRIRLSAATVNGRIGNNTSYAQKYNDQFHENSQGQVTYADGTVVYVTPTFNSKVSPISTASTAGAIPLTVTAMSTPGNAYYANPQPVTGQILASSNAAVVLNTVDPVHGAILTGTVGLPISAIQINPALSGVSIPGVIQTTDAGDVTTGYPEFSANLTSIYTVPSGWLKGFRFGGSVVVGWLNREYYFYTNGPNPGAARNMFYFPTQAQINLILGYSKKFRRVTFNTQLNVSNLFNHYDIVILPDEGLGYSNENSLNATFTAQPRQYVWSSSISF